jgi:colicin import membrane protein
MQAVAETLDLSPPDGGRWRGPLTTALAVHGLLVLALTWGVGWQRDTVVVAEAELWSRLPQQAAPRAVEPEPEPTPQPAAKPEPVRPAPPPPAPAAQDAQIALQKKKEQERLKQQQAEQQRRDAQKLEEKRKAEQQAKLEKAAREKAERERLAKQEAQLEAERKKNLERMLGQANAMGSTTSRGTAAQSSGPSASYAGRLVARIRPNIVFTDTVNGNPRAEVEVRALPDGTIVGSRLLKSSGHSAWDDAVLRAVERTGRLPQDENGRVPSTLILGFRPQD